METTNTNSFEIKPVGKYALQIDKIIKKSIGKEGGKQYPGYEWKFTIRYSDQNLDDNNFKLFMFKSSMADLLRALGATEEKPGEFVWDMEAQYGKIFECDLIHQDISGKLREQLINIKLSDDNTIAKLHGENEELAWDHNEK